MPGSFKPYRQGDLDGLCGIYAVINAVSFLCPEMDRETARDLFRVLNARLRRIRGTSDVVWGGLCPAFLPPILTAAQTYLEEELSIRVQVQPLTISAEPASLAHVWSALQKQIGSRVAILALGGRNEHWSVAYNVTAKTMKLLDSDRLKLMRRSRCTVALSETRYRLDPRAVFIMRR